MKLRMERFSTSRSTELIFDSRLLATHARMKSILRMKHALEHNGVGKPLTRKLVKLRVSLSQRVLNITAQKFIASQHITILCGK